MNKEYCPLCKEYKAEKFFKKNSPWCVSCNMEWVTKINMKKREKRRKIYKDIDIFNRDNWICGICGETIDKKIKCPEPMSGVIDHIVPVSKGGGSEKSNLQAAHFICNGKKSNKLDFKITKEPLPDSCAKILNISILCVGVTSNYQSLPAAVTSYFLPRLYDYQAGNW